jgi:agmatine deiminase
MRDSGPIIVKNGTEREALNFNFNGWAKYKKHSIRQICSCESGRILNIP